MITAFIKMDGKNFQFSVKKLNRRKIHPYWETFPSKDIWSDCGKFGKKANSEMSRSYLRLYSFYASS